MKIRAPAHWTFLDAQAIAVSIGIRLKYDSRLTDSDRDLLERRMMLLLCGRPV